PSCLKKRKFPLDDWPVDPLKRMNWVVYPPPLTRCGKSISAAAGAPPSLLGGVVVIRKSPRSLYRARKPVIDNPKVVPPETLSTPLNGNATVGNSSWTKLATWPLAGTVILTGSAAAA